jgi:hypothetical protein
MKHFIFITVLTLGCSALWAGPAAWYRWHSAEGDYDVCAQFSPGDGWVIVKGPFEDSGCKKPMPSGA